ncbi:MAG: CcmE/CycJ protein [Acidimicrobiales bacterium]|nr:CcmE/CycJ protein [Acidimicrobiales bacterium]
MNTRVVVALAAIAAALIILFVNLGQATQFFRTADQAVAQRAKLGHRRFRIEGTVVDGSVHTAGQQVAFVIESKGARVDVLHTGDPPQLFKPGIPVVLEGRFEGQHFASDRILVKHTESYKVQHPDRVSTTVAG